jgi:hypothetical protein
MAKASKSAAAPKKAAAKKSTEKRELIEPNGDKRYIKRNEDGTIRESDDVSKSLSQDVKKRAKKTVASGHGDQGDGPQKKSAAKKTVAKKTAAKKAVATKSTAKKSTGK